MYQSIPSLTIPPPGDPGDSTHSHCPGSGFHPTFLARGLGFRIEKIFYRKKKATSRFVSKKLEAE